MISFLVLLGPFGSPYYLGVKRAVFATLLSIATITYSIIEQPEAVSKDHLIGRAMVAFPWMHRLNIRIELYSYIIKAITGPFFSEMLPMHPLKRRRRRRRRRRKKKKKKKISFFISLLTAVLFVCLCICIYV